MAHYVALDVSQQETHICIVDEKNRQIWQGKCLTSPTAINDKITRHAPNPEKVGLETGPLTTWLWHELTALKLPAVVMEARHAKRALSANINKTDKKDAQGLARLLQTGFYKEVRVKGFDAHKVRASLSARATLVRTGVDIRNQLRGLLKVHGIVLTPKKLKNLDKELDPANFHDDSIKVLFELMKVIQDKLNHVDKVLEKSAQDDPVTRRLMTVPGVGPVTAVAFRATIDDPESFKKSRNVAAYVGLTPRRHQSGEMDISGRISKCGDRLLRSCLYAAGHAILSCSKGTNPLKEWGKRIEARSGAKKAKVALARKLAVIIHRMLVSGEEYRAAAAAAVPAAA